MILTKFLRWCGFQIWTEAELIEALTRVDPPGKPPAPVSIDHLIRREK